MQAISLISGGLDSTVATWAAAHEHPIALGLTVDYGQRAAQQEANAAAAICALLGCRHEVLDLRWLGRLGHNALTDFAMTLPEPQIDLLDHAACSAETAQAVWVPNRNGLFIAAAAAYCEATEAELIIVGFNAEEAASFPDNSADFLTATNRALALSTQLAVEVASPTIDLEKPEIVALGLSLGAPLDLIWACYEGGAKHCMKCESCLRLRRALQAAGHWDAWRATA
jgi:7-cyano-7-deazaguanine synthase